MNHRKIFHFGLFVLLFNIIILMVNRNPHMITYYFHIVTITCGFVMTYGAYKKIVEN